MSSALLLRGAVLLGLALVGAASSGCSGLFHSDTPATQVYVLRAKPTPVEASPKPTASLHVSRPLAAPGMDTDHILLVQSDHRMSFYVASKWPADLPAVVESLAVDSLRASGQWSTIQDSGSAFPADYLLQIVIRRFEADYSTGSSAPEVHVLLDCTMGRRAGRDIILSFMAEGSATATANRLGDVVTAFEQASNKALEQITSRTAQAVQSAQKVESPVPSITR